jgi:hypothetical protein
MKVELLNTEIKTQEQGMLQGFNDSKDVVKDIHDRLTILQEKSKTFSGRIMMSGKDKALLQRQTMLHSLKLKTFWKQEREPAKRLVTLCFLP